VIERTRGLDRAAEIIHQAFGIDQAAATEGVALSHAQDAGKHKVPRTSNQQFAVRGSPITLKFLTA
jgi:hypothetical protein